MQQGKQQANQRSRKWVDFSEDSEEDHDEGQENHHHHHTHTHTRKEGQSQKQSTKQKIDHRSTQFIQLQLRRLDDAKKQFQQIWVLLQSQDRNTLENVVRDLREQNNKDIINIYRNKDIQGSWDLKVKEDLIKNWIQNGIDPARKIRVTVSDRNFRSRDRGDRRGGKPGGGRGGRGGDRGDRRDRRGRGDRGDRVDRGDRGDRGDRRDRERTDNGQQKKKVYVDKLTGKAPTNKTQIQKQIIQEKSRQYSKLQAEKVGTQLGNFRNKNKVLQLQRTESVQQTPDVKPPVLFKAESQRVEPVTQFSRKPKEQSKPWSRKTREELKEGRLDQKDEYKNPKYKQPKVQYRQKEYKAVQNEQKSQKNEGNLQSPKKKKTYVAVNQQAKQQKSELKSVQITDTVKQANFIDEDHN